MIQCPQSNVTRCITDWNICDGVPQCPGAEDELGMETSGGVSITCDAPGAACILGRPRHPWSQYSLGVSCGQGQGGRGRGRRGRGCLQRRAWCDGTCDCDACHDELQCDTWQCGVWHDNWQVTGNYYLNQARASLAVSVFLRLTWLQPGQDLSHSGKIIIKLHVSSLNI